MEVEPRWNVPGNGPGRPLRVSMPEALPSPSEHEGSALEAVADHLQGCLREVVEVVEIHALLADDDLVVLAPDAAAVGGAELLEEPPPLSPGEHLGPDELAAFHLKE